MLRPGDVMLLGPEVFGPPAPGYTLSCTGNYMMLTIKVMALYMSGIQVTI